MKDNTKDPTEETLTLLTSDVAVHEDGDHACLVSYEPVRDGEDLRGKNVFVRRADGSYERFGSKGPAQVATPAYRENWKQVFNSPGGTS